MPAPSASLISVVLGDLAGLPEADRGEPARQVPRLAEYLAWVPDARGVRHSCRGCCWSRSAVLAGARSLAMIGEWIADASPPVVAALGVRRNPLTGVFEPPDEKTIRTGRGYIFYGTVTVASIRLWLRP